MGKGLAIGVLAGILAGTAIGYFVIPLIFPTQSSKIYSDYSNAATYLNNEAGVMVDVVVEFTALQNVVIHCDFRCTVFIIGDAESSNDELVVARFYIDGVEYGSPVGVIQIDDALIPDGTYMGLIMTLHGTHALSAGAHNVTVQLDPEWNLAHSAGEKSLVVTVVPA